MKTINNKRKIFFAFLVTALVTGTVLMSCDKDDDVNDNGNMLTLSGAASGAKEIPANPTTGSGTLTGTYNKRTNSLTYTISWTGLTGNVTAAHFHGPASTTETADPMLGITIGANGASGSVSATATVTDAFENALLDGKVYYNIHTALYPNGEIRSQVQTSGTSDSGNGASGGSGGGY